ncbi:hypothetical protein QBC36DRAFT_137235 [Triangularia setosa]|uniref:Uncharacterized protein n=1 Tax=Triangularia setosa TaxID=2587417 RepID=A0AAN7A260_9PEZI|nr:hypothetical protein QBC36DRAFT_137235 [Podospora setosa]
MESSIFRLRSGKLVSLLATVLAVVSDSKTYLGMAVFKPDDLKIYPVFRLGWVCPGSVECVLDRLGTNGTECEFVPIPKPMNSLSVLSCIV